MTHNVPPACSQWRALAMTITNIDKRIENPQDFPNQPKEAIAANRC